MSEFQFPPVHNFPPFFTRQPTEATWQSQVAQWSDLMMRYCRHYGIFTLNVHEATVPGNSKLFENSKLKRRVSFEMLQELLNEMVQQGNAEWENPKTKTSALIYWRKPEDWANLIWTWVNETGSNNTIMTVFELAHGDLTQDQPFHNMDKAMLIKALNVLVKRGVAQLFQGTSDDDEMGVKFFGSQ